MSHPPRGHKRHLRFFRMKTSSALRSARGESRAPWLVIGALVVAAAIIALDYLACVASLHYRQDDYYAYAKEYQQHCTLFHGPVFILILSCVAWLWSIFHSAHDEIVAASAVGILLVIATLAHYTRALWKETVQLGEKADDNAAQQARDTQAALAHARTSADAAALNAEIAQKSLYLLQRPYVVRSRTVDCGVELFVHGKDDATIGCTFVNEGMTPAILVELYLDMKLVPAGDLPPVIDPGAVFGEMHPPSRLIARDSPERFDVQIAKHVRQMEVRSAVINGKGSLFLYGFMRYRDIFGKQYRHGFCGRYDGRKNDFDIHGGGEYNYSEDDAADRMPPMSPANVNETPAWRPVSALRNRRA